MSFMGQKNRGWDAGSLWRDACSLGSEVMNFIWCDASKHGHFSRAYKFVSKCIGHKTCIACLLESNTAEMLTKPFISIFEFWTWRKWEWTRADKALFYINLFINIQVGEIRLPCVCKLNDKHCFWIWSFKTLNLLNVGYMLGLHFGLTSFVLW